VIKIYHEETEEGSINTQTQFTVPARAGSNYLSNSIFGISNSSLIKYFAFLDFF
jgi:hypothetical protein